MQKETNSSFQIVDLAELGPTAVASRGFSPGDVVLREVPTLVIPNENPEKVFLEISRKHELPEDFFTSLSAFDKLQVSEMERLIVSIHSPLAVYPSRNQPESFYYSKSEVSAVMELLSLQNFELAFQKDHFAFWKNLQKDDRSPQQKKNGQQHLDPAVAGIPLQVRKICSLIHGIRINMHSDQKSQYSGVYSLAMKFAHSCSPNTFWYLERDDRIGAVVHVATRTINVSEPISFSYIGTGMNLVSYTLQRRMLLSSLNFTCQCSRCAAFDQQGEVCRCLRCPRCCDNDAVSSSMSLVLQPQKYGGWYCPKCNSTIGRDEVQGPLLEEAIFMEAVMGYFYSASPGYGSIKATHPALEDLGSFADGLSRRWFLLQAVKNTLSRSHYLFAVSAVGMLRCFLQAMKATTQNEAAQDLSLFLESHPAAEWSSELMRLIIEGDHWFQSNMKGSPQHRKFQCLAVELSASLIHKQKLSEMEKVEKYVSQNFKQVVKPLCGFLEFAPIYLTQEELENQL